MLPAQKTYGFIFGVAASATLIYGEEHLSRTIARLRRPDVSARGEDGSILKVPVAGDGFIHMQGRRVFMQQGRIARIEEP